MFAVTKADEVILTSVLETLEHAKADFFLEHIMSIHVETSFIEISIFPAFFFFGAIVKLTIGFIPIFECLVFWAILFDFKVGDTISSEFGKTGDVAADLSREVDRDGDGVQHRVGMGSVLDGL